MRVAIYVTAGAPRELALAHAIRDGCAVHGDHAQVIRLADYRCPEHDVAVLVGRSSRRVFQEYLRCGRPCLIIEKGFFDRKRYDRVEVWVRRDMRIAFYVAAKDRNWGLAEALAEGARVHRDEVEIIDQKSFAGVRGDFDGGACLGVKRAGKRLLTAHLQSGQHFLFFDKGYMGRSEHVRVALDAWQPLAYFQKQKRPDDRFRKLGIKLKGRRKSDGMDHILFAASSQKYCNFHDLGTAASYAERAVRKLAKRSRRPIVYRPKPSHHARHSSECPPIDGTRYSVGTPIAADLERCHLLVTHGSNAAFDALAAGVPVMVMGEGICRPMSMGEEWGRVESPFWPSDADRHQFFCDAAYCQWTLSEFRSGEAWADIRATLAKLPLPKGGSKYGLDELIEQYRVMHKHPKYFRGRDAQKHFGRIGKLILATGTKTLLDYGCGKGEQYDEPISLQEAWDVEVACYDPGVEKFASIPEGKFDAVICCDVMEHIPEKHVQTILLDCLARASKFAFFSIATTPASKCLPDGRNCHVTVRPEEWWRAELAKAQAVYPDVRVEAWIQPDPEFARELFNDDDDAD